MFPIQKKLSFEEKPKEKAPAPEPTEPSGVERPSPTGTIPQSSVERYSDRIVIKQPGLRLVQNIADTNSMDPLFDTKHTLIVRGRESFNDNDLKKGEIIVYMNELGDLISHRIIKVDADANGNIYTCEGDNNNTPDTCIIRYANIKYLVVGIVYTKQA